MSSQFEKIKSMSLKTFAKTYARFAHDPEMYALQGVTPEQEKAIREALLNRNDDRSYSQMGDVYIADLLKSNEQVNTVAYQPVSFLNLPSMHPAEITTNKRFWIAFNEGSNFMAIPLSNNCDDICSVWASQYSEYEKVSILTYSDIMASNVVIIKR